MVRKIIALRTLGRTDGHSDGRISWIIEDLSILKTNISLPLEICQENNIQIILRYQEQDIKDIKDQTQPIKNEILVTKERFLHRTKLH